METLHNFGMNLNYKWSLKSSDKKNQSDFTNQSQLQDKMNEAADSPRDAIKGLMNGKYILYLTSQ